jgi:hypothetical protein
MSVDVRRPESSGAFSPASSQLPAVPPATLEVDELVATLRPRLEGVAVSSEVERLVRTAYAELGPVTVTTYLPILIERRIRQQLRSTDAAVPPVDLREARVTA